MFRFLVLLLPLAIGCSATERLSPAGIELPAPFVEQDELHACGLSAVSALCAYHGIRLPETVRLELARLSRENLGLSAGELRDALEDVGFEVFLFPGTTGGGPTGLPHHIGAGRPVLVLLQEDGSAHYVLVTGHDPQDGRMVLLDPSRGRVVVGLTDFERQWDASQRLALLAVPHRGARSVPP